MFRGATSKPHNSEWRCASPRNYIVSKHILNSFIKTNIIWSEEFFGKIFIKWDQAPAGMRLLDPRSARREFGSLDWRPDYLGTHLFSLPKGEDIRPMSQDHSPDNWIHGQNLSYRVKISPGTQKKLFESVFSVVRHCGVISCINLKSEQPSSRETFSWQRTGCIEKLYLSHHHSRQIDFDFP